MIKAALLLSSVFNTDFKKQCSVVFITLCICIALPFAAVFSMGTDVMQFLSKAPNVHAANTQGFYMGGEVPGNTYAWGNCTYWSFAMRLWAGNPIPSTWGNANTWDDRARQDGYVVDQIPAVGAVYQTDAGGYGHVAYVIAVNQPSGEWTISEMNNKGLNVVNTRTLNQQDAKVSSFIHDKKGRSVWTPSLVPLEKQYLSQSSKSPR